MGMLKEKDATQIAKALGDPTRFAIFKQVSENEEVFCGEVCKKHAVSPATVSHHLKVLTELGLIASRKEGLNVFYRSVPKVFANYVSYLQDLQRK